MAGNGIINHRVEDYLYSLLPKRDPVLTWLEKDAAKNDVPIIGPLCGNVISMILQSAKAEKALEIGTATGYSGIWISRALQGKNKKLVTIEMDPERRKFAEKSFENAGLSGMVEILSGDAKILVPGLSSKGQAFDAVFLDVGDKTLYVDLLNPCLELLPVGGYLIADNTLWNGDVANPKDRSEKTRIIRRFNELVFRNEKLDAAIIPLRDGFTVARKKKQ